MADQTDLLTRYLPAELIIEIFTQVLVPDKRAEWTDYSPPHTILTPFFLAKICRPWRSIVWNNASLWSTLTLTLNREHYEAQVSLLSTWLERSGSLPLTIIMRGPGGDEEEDWEMKPPFEAMEQLAAVSERWKNVDMFIPYPCYSQLRSIQSRLPLAESLSIRPPDGVDSLFDYKLDFFSSAPALRSLKLNGVYYADTTSLPYDQLHHLEAQDFLAEDCYSMLSSASHLRTVHFHGVQSSTDFAYPARETISLPDLETLDISSIGNMLAKVFLYSLELPSLQTLSLSLGFSFDDWESFSLSTVTSLIGRSGCATSLLRLSITNLRLVEQELIDCLASAPNLESLHLHVEYPKTTPGMNLSDTFFSALVPPSSRNADVTALLPFDRPLVPHLKVLEYSGPIHVSDDVLRTMLDYRWNHDPEADSSGHLKEKLSNVCIESASAVSFSSDTQSLLRDFVEQGMDLILTNGYTSWIHDSWASIQDIVRGQRRRGTRRSAKGKGKAAGNGVNGDEDGDEWVPHRHMSSYVFQYPLTPPRISSAIGPAVILARRSQTPGTPPRRPLTNPTSKPAPIAYSISDQ